MEKAIVVCTGLLLGSAMILGAGILLGTLRGELRAKASRFSDEQKVITGALASDPAWSHVSAEMYTGDGTAILFGDVKTKEDKDRLRARMLKLFGETRVDDLVRGVGSP